MGGDVMDGSLKIGLTVLALVTGGIYTAERVMGMDMSATDVVRLLVQHGTEFLHRLFYF
ncbi:conserved hypothetical protein [Cupriavidus oxalaticus]|nr:conserved hypothetical protein [Cupriavidus oxalaticus]SPC24407.1 conserved hypothetical protein [Cupriavidus oxalaticus]